MAFTGPGAFSIDALVGWTAGGAGWGLAALAAGLAGGALQLTQRRPAPPQSTRLAA